VAVDESSGRGCDVVVEESSGGGGDDVHGWQ